MQRPHSSPPGVGEMMVAWLWTVPFAIIVVGMPWVIFNFYGAWWALGAYGIMAVLWTKLWPHNFIESVFSVPFSSPLRSGGSQLLAALIVQMSTLLSVCLIISPIALLAIGIFSFFGIL